MINNSSNDDLIKRIMEQQESISAFQLANSRLQDTVKYQSEEIDKLKNDLLKWKKYYEHATGFPATKYQ